MIYMLFYIFVILSAYTLDRYGLKFTIVIGAVLNGLGSCLRLIGSSRDGFVFAFLGNASAAFAQCFILFVPPTLAASWFGDKERATASAIGVLMNMLGVAIGFLMGGTMVPSSDDYNGEVKQGMFNTLMAQAVFCTFLVVICVVFVKNSPPTPPTRSQMLIWKSKDEKEKKKSKEMKVKGILYQQKNDESNIENRSEAVSSSSSTSPGFSSTSLDGAVSAPSNEVELKPGEEKIDSKGFVETLKILSKDKTFHLVTQAYGFYFGLFAAYNTVLNQMCTPIFPGKEEQIGLMGFTSVILGLVGIFLAGLWIDKTSNYRLISIITFACCTISLLIFTLLLQFTSNFPLVFASFCIFGFFSYPYMTVGLEHAAEVTYPISEGTTSGILLLVGNMYGILMTFIFGAIIEKGYSHVAGYLMALCYAVGLLMAYLIHGELKRLKHDRIVMNDLLQKEIEMI